MITKYEKAVIEVKDHVEETTLSFVDKEEDADYVHFCGHDEKPQTPCKRVKIK